MHSRVLQCGARGGALNWFDLPKLSFRCVKPILVSNPCRWPQGALESAWTWLSGMPFGLGLDECIG